MIENLIYCSNCGKKNPDESKFCNACGTCLFHPDTKEQKEIDIHTIADTDLKKVNVLFIIFLTIITLGIYCPIWFLTRRKSINNLQSNKKLGIGIFVFIILLQILSFILAIFSGSMEGINAIDALTGFDGIIGIILIVQGFKVRRIFINHFNSQLQREISFSGVATFFFHIYYLQYKINRFK